MLWNFINLYLVLLGPLVIEDIKRIIRESEVTKCDDSRWPEPTRDGRQELEIKMDREHIAFTVSSFCLINSIFMVICVT